MINTNTENVKICQIDNPDYKEEELLQTAVKQVKKNSRSVLK